MASQQSTHAPSRWMNDDEDVNVDPRITQEERDHEIDRVNNAGTDNEVLGAESTYMSTQKDFQIAYQVIARLVHPDKQVQGARIEDATRAMARLNNAMDSLRIQPDLPEVPSDMARPDRFHKNIYKQSNLKGHVRRLQITPQSAGAIYGIDLVNKALETYNRSKNIVALVAQFPISFLQRQYTVAANIRAEYRVTTDEDQKTQAKKMYKLLGREIRSFQEENGYPPSWAFESLDPSNEPVNDEKVQSSIALSPDPSDGLLANLSPFTGSVNVNAPVVLDSAMNVDSITTVTGEQVSILAKRKFGERYRFLVSRERRSQALEQGRERNIERVWLPDTEIGAQDFSRIPDIMKPNDHWIKNRKFKYRTITWIALSEFGAVTVGAGQWPPITVCVTWSDDTPETILWRSDAIKAASRSLVDRDVRKYLYTVYESINGRDICIMSPTREGLKAGSTKATSYLQREENNVLRTRLALTAPASFNQVLLPDSMPPAQRQLESNVHGQSAQNGFQLSGSIEQALVQKMMEQMMPMMVQTLQQLTVSQPPSYQQMSQASPPALTSQQPPFQQVTPSNQQVLPDQYTINQQPFQQPHLQQSLQQLPPANQHQPFQQVLPATQQAFTNQQQPFQQVPPANQQTLSNQRQPFQQAPPANQQTLLNQQQPFQQAPPANQQTLSNQRQPFQQAPPANQQTLTNYATYQQPSIHQNDDEDSDV